MIANSSACVEGVVVEYTTANGRVRALDDVSFNVEAGSSVAIVGPSGCGKSTLLGVLAGLAVPTHGSVTIGLSPISAMSDRERSAFRARHLGLVYQSDNLLPFLTVIENVALQLALCDGATADHRPRDVLAILGLEQLADRLPDELSGGQRQRAAVARAVVHRPALLLADEPTGALDAANAHAVIDLLLSTGRDINATLVIVTHDMEAARLTDRVMVLRAGRLVDDSRYRGR